MGNVSGRKDEAGPSGTRSAEEEEYMEYAHGLSATSCHGHGGFPVSMVQHPQSPTASYQSTLMFPPQIPAVPLERPDEIMQIQVEKLKPRTTEYICRERGIPTMIIWNHSCGGNQVAVEGSWDDWKTRELLQRSGIDSIIMKVLPSGVYRYRFLVDGEWRYAPDLPREHDEMGNIFNILDLREHVPEIIDNVSEPESPSSPGTPYDNASFIDEDFKEKVPELPPFLQKTPLDHLSAFMDSPDALEKPSFVFLNHLYIQKGCSGQPMVTLGTTHRFGTKYVTVAIYKSLRNVKK